MANIWFFDKVDLFDVLCSNQLDYYKQAHEIKIYDKGEYIYFNNDPSKSIYLIASGKVKILRYTSSGEELVKAILTKGELFGELAIFGEKNRDDIAMAIEDETILCQIGIDQVRDLMVKDKTFAQKFNHLVGARMKKLERRLDSMAFKDVKTRIIEFIHEFAEEKGVKKGTEVYIKSYLTHKDIADLVGTSRQTVTSTLNELKSKQKISFNRKSLIVHDMENFKLKE